MVSPLQTWQHQDPKYLWWLLGGLSVMAHVGILGLSLPYVLELMASDAVRSPITVPVELVAIDPTIDPTEQEIEDATDNSAPSTAPPSPTIPSTAPPSPTVPSTDIPATTIATTEQTAPTEAGNAQRTGNAENSGVVDNGPDNGLAQRDAPTPDIRPATPPSTVNAPAAPIQPSPPETIESSEVQPTNQPSIQAPVDQAPFPQDVAGDGSVDRGDQPVTDNLIRRPGEVNPIFSANETIEPDITTPELTESELTESETTEAEGLEGEGSRSMTGEGTGESDRAQAVSFRVVGFRIAPVQDLPAVPPQLIESDSIIELQPSSLGCGLVDFSQSQRTYRLAIDATGNLSTITRWTEGRGEPLSESAPMACLIRAAGLTFQPAKAVDGTPTLDDSLLLTVEVLELQGPRPNTDGP